MMTEVLLLLFITVMANRRKTDNVKTVTVLKKDSDPNAVLDDNDETKDNGSSGNWRNDYYWQTCGLPTADVLDRLTTQHWKALQILAWLTPQWPRGGPMKAIVDTSDPMIIVIVIPVTEANCAIIEPNCIIIIGCVMTEGYYWNGEMTIIIVC